MPQLFKFGGIMTSRSIVTALIALSLTCAGCEEDAACNADELSSTLFRAFEGDTVTVGACELSGSFTVPSGVTLEGASAVLVSDSDEPVLRVEPGASPPTVRGLTVRSSGDAAILIRGTGEAVLEDLVVETSRGIGIGVEDVEALTLRNVTIDGLVTAEQAEELAADPDREEVATHGLALVRVVSASLVDVRADRFASTGVLAVSGEVDWSGGGTLGNRGTGVMVHGGIATLQNLELCGGITGQSPVPATSLAIEEGAVVTTEDLLVCESQGIGIFQEGSTSSHVDLVARDNTHGGLWAQNNSTVTIEGSASELVDNGFVGAAFIDSGAVTLESALFARTVMSSSPFESHVDSEAGDGVQLVRPGGAIVLRDLRVEENARVGILYEQLPPSFGTQGPTLNNIHVTGEGDQLGVIFQSPDGDEAQQPWDADEAIQRNGVIATNDAEFEGHLDMAESADQSEVPDTDDVEQDGLDALL